MDAIDPGCTVSVVIVNYRSAEETLAAIDRLPTWCRRTVVDNHSTDSEFDRLAQRLSKSVNLIRNKTNVGFAGGVNAALVARDNSDWTLIHNPDAEISPTNLRRLILTARDEQLDLASPLITGGDGNAIWFAGGNWDKRTLGVTHWRYGSEVPQIPQEQTLASPFISGCLMLLSRRALELLPMEEDLFMYYEDVELCIRAQQAGMRAGVVMTALARHHEGISSGGRGSRRSSLYYYYQSRNRLLLARRISPMRLILALPSGEYMRYARQILAGGGHGRAAALRAVAGGVFGGVRGKAGRTHA